MRLPSLPASSCLLLLLLVLFVGQVRSLQPTAPVVASPNTESSPSNFVFSFELINNLSTSSYLMVVLPFYPATITPLSCNLLGPLSSLIAATSCANLYTQSLLVANPLSINTTAVNNINPNIQANLTIVMGFNGVLAAGTSHSVQLRLQDNLPAIGALSVSFEMYSISGTGVMLEENWNMGQVYLQLKNNNLMTLVSINSQIGNLPGSTVSTLLVDATIGIASPTAQSVFLFTISGNYQFTVSSLVTSIAVSGTPPQILSTSVVSPNIIKVIFNEQFTVGRHFRLTVSNVYNPQEISQGAVSVYSLPYNSISPLEVSQLSIPFQTVKYTPTLNIYTAEGIAPTSPMLFYMSTNQYLTLTILLPRLFDPSFILQIASDVLTFQQGTVYARTSTINSNSLVYTLTNSNTIQISGFSTIPSGSLITVTMRAWFDTSPIFNIYVSIDTKTHIIANAPIIYGTASSTVSAIPSSYISNFKGSAGESNKLTVVQGGTSSFSFSVSPSFTTYTGSYLQIYVSKYMTGDVTFNGNTSCLINTVAQPCTIATNTQYTLITIASSTSSNLYPISTTTNVVINQLAFTSASSHAIYLYHFYFQLTVSLANLAATNLYLISPMVVQQRNSISNFKPYFSNNIYNTGTNYLNVIRLVSSDSTQWQNTIQVNQKRIISIFAYKGWTNLFTTLTSYSTYPCVSNLAVTCTFIQGSNTVNLTNEFPLNWDRINIILPGTQSSTKFSIIIPTQYISTDPHYFEILIGYIDTNNGAVTYLQTGQDPGLGVASNTYLQPIYFAPTANAQMPNKPKQANMQLNIAGLAGSYASNIDFTVVPSNLYQGTTYSSCLIVMSSWNFLDGLTSLSSTSLASVNPQFANVEQKPLSLQISSSNYLTYIPLTTTGAYTSSFNINFNNIKIPYILDLPYYSVTLVDYLGNVDGYNEFINQNQNIFYTGVLSALNFTCNDNSLGVTNTYCTAVFTTFQDIQVGSIFIVNFYGMFVSTNLCSMIYTSTNVSVPVKSCTPNTNLNVLTVTLANTARLPGLTSYSLLINGISIDGSQISNYVNFQFMDPTGSYAIQQKTSILLTSVSQNFPIYITQVFFAYNNPVVTSTLFLNFTLPRSLNSDEAFALVLSKDFITLNNIPSKLYIRLMQADGITQIPATWVLKFINSQIIFEGLQSVLGPYSYSLELYGIQTPSTITQDMISVIFLRIYDNSYTKSNTASSTAVFPSLTSKVSSLISLQTFFNTEGLEQQLQFTVINQYATITQNTIWIVNLPIYYPELVWNDENLIYCTISGVPLTCAPSKYTPYQIVLSNSPLILQASGSTTYTINIYGIPCPRAAYLNGNNMFITQSIFLAMATSAAATSYADYSLLFITSAILNPQTSVGYGSIILKSVASSNMQVYQSTFLTITLSCTVAIPVNSWIFITFPQQFDNFNNIPMILQTQYSTINYQVSSNSSVVNTRVGYKLTVLNIPANTQFQIMITSLLAPKSAVTIDMNKLRVVVATSDRSLTIATSLQSRNQLGSLTFIPNSLHLVVNSYNPIYVTAGTYSTPIQIKPSDNSTFLTNMMIKFSSAQLVFSPNPLYLYLGNSFSTVIIGAGQNLIPTSYTFNLVKQETSISAYYSTLSEYAVIVNSLPTTISFPSSFTVPLGGCSIPTVISLTNPPYSYININYQYNTTLAPPNLFWVSQSISYEQPQFNLNNTQRWVSFCSSAKFSAMSFNVNLNIGGDNAASYTFSNSYTTINIVNAVSAAVIPSFSIVASNVQKTFAAIQVTTNLPGFFYYQLMISPLSSPLSLSSIQTYVKSNNATLASNNDYLTTQIYIGDRDHRVGYASATVAGNNFVNIMDLMPQRNYTLCGYLESQYSQISSSQCTNFTMQSWGVISKAYISFTSPILANALNNVLCFFVKASNSQINQIVDLQGSSCSLNTSPQNYFYKYNGNTTTSQATSTIIYHTANLNLTTDASISAFKSLFDNNGITSTSLALAQTQFSIKFVNVSKFIGTFDPMSAMQPSASDFQPAISLTINTYTPDSRQIQVVNISSNIPSSVYFILVSYKNITTNQISSKTMISIKPLVTPTSDQIASCVDGGGYAAVQCMRVVMQSNSTYSFKFTNIVENSVYSVYYTYANEYPQRPVFYGEVKSQQVYTISFQSNLQFLIVLLFLALVLMI